MSCSSPAPVSLRMNPVPVASQCPVELGQIHPHAARAWARRTRRRATCASGTSSMIDGAGRVDEHVRVNPDHALVSAPRILDRGSGTSATQGIVFGLARRRPAAGRCISGHSRDARRSATSWADSVFARAACGKRDGQCDDRVGGAHVRGGVRSARETPADRGGLQVVTRMSRTPRPAAPVSSASLRAAVGACSARALPALAEGEARRTRVGPPRGHARNEDRPQRSLPTSFSGWCRCRNNSAFSFQGRSG